MYCLLMCDIEGLESDIPLLLGWRIKGTGHVCNCQRPVFSQKPQRIHFIQQRLRQLSFSCSCGVQYWHSLVCNANLVCSLKTLDTIIFFENLTSIGRWSCEIIMEEKNHPCHTKFCAFFKLDFETSLNQFKYFTEKLLLSQKLQREPFLTII